MTAAGAGDKAEFCCHAFDWTLPIRFLDSTGVHRYADGRIARIDLAYTLGPDSLNAFRVSVVHPQNGPIDSKLFVFDDYLPRDERADARKDYPVSPQNQCFSVSPHCGWSWYIARPKSTRPLVDAIESYVALFGESELPPVNARRVARPTGGAPARVVIMHDGDDEHPTTIEAFLVDNGENFDSDTIAMIRALRPGETFTDGGASPVMLSAIDGDEPTREANENAALSLAAKLGMTGLELAVRVAAITGENVDETTTPFEGLSDAEVWHVAHQLRRDLASYRREAGGAGITTEVEA